MMGLASCRWQAQAQMDGTTMTIEKDGMGSGEPEQLRPARMQIETTVLMSRRGESHPTELVDISATGALLRRPLGWSGDVGQSWVLDMIFGHNLHIHLEAAVVRISDHYIGFSYSRIPEDKQVPLWNLLGGYADILENWKDR
jgi:PilZ domain